MTYLQDAYIQDAIDHAAVTLLWQATDSSEDGGSMLGDSRVGDYYAQVVSDVPYLTEAVTAFVTDNWGTLQRAGVVAEQCGHDFILTANGHGAGFWDRGLGADGDALTKATRGYSFEADFMLDDDGDVTWLCVENTVLVDTEGAFIMTAHYTTDSDGNPGLANGNWPYYGTKLPYVLGDGVVREIAESIAEDMTEAARTSPGPVVFVTGNSYLPALRSYVDAERVWHAENDADGELFVFLVEELERLLSAAEVYLGAPDYDNALYVVDLRRWQSSGTWDNFDGYYADDLNAEWEAVAHCPHPACTDPSDPHISHGDH